MINVAGAAASGWAWLKALLLVAWLAGSTACADGEASRLERSESSVPGSTGSTGGAPASLRAATIAAVQAGAPRDYDLVEASDEAGAFVGRIPTQALAVRASARGLELGPEGGPAHLSLRLASAGCAGAQHAARATTPTANENRATFAHELGGGRQVEAWYLSGPLGLEHGFTLARDWGCLETELVVTVEGAAIEAIGDELELVSDDDGARYSYTDLFAYDAKGNTLPTRMELGDTGEVALVVETRGATFPVVVDPLVATQQAKLVASDAASNSWFGWSVSISGDSALVGAQEDDHAGGVNAGSAYVFVRSGSVWTQQAKLVASDAATGDHFGFSVALTGDTALVGAPNDDHVGGVNAGSAYVFVRTGSTWSQQAKLLASDGALSDELGRAVALSGDSALVGSPTDTHTGVSFAGSAYVFVRSGVTWTQQAKLVANDPATSDNLGFSVGLDGDTAVLGAVFDEHSGGTDEGSAYVFVRSGTTWTQQAKLVASDAGSFDRLGMSVALGADTAVVGSIYDAGTGSAYVFVRSGTTWTQQAKLLASDGANNDRFGISAAVRGDTALIGAYADGSFAGSAYVFTRAGATWTEQVKLVASDPAVGDSFGYSLALDGGRALIGAIDDDHPGVTNAGSAYVFLLEEKLDLGGACGLGSDCLSGFCADGVCCDSDCGGSDGSDCQACSLAAGAPSDGTCAPSTAGTQCRSTVGACDVAETCDGTSTACPVDAAQPTGAPCGGAPSGDCDAQDVCAGSVGASATCVLTFATAGTMCSDGSACTVGDVCDVAGACLSGGAVTCDDGNDCTSESCDPMVGCVVANMAEDTPCDDGSECSAGDRCVSGTCTPAMGLSCDDDNSCTANDCDVASGCLNTPLATATPCNDGDACTVMDACDGSGKCVGATALDCDDSNPCTSNACDSATGCVFEAEPDGTPCPGGVCLAGACDTSGQGGAGGEGGAGGSDGGGAQGGAPTGGGGEVPTGGAPQGGGGPGGQAGGPSPQAEGCSCRVAGLGAPAPDLSWLVLVALFGAMTLRPRRVAETR